MDDMERYGDYTEYEDDAPKKKSGVVGTILKVLVAVVCIGVIGLFAFRMIVFEYYPDSMKELYFNDTLTEYYNATDGNIGAITQDLRAPYDDPKTGNFLAGNLIIIEGAEQLQCSLRFNTAVIRDLNEKYGLSLSPKNAENFTFRLTRNHETEDNVFVPIGELSAAIHDSYVMYEGYKLVFDGVDLLRGEDGEVKWLALEIYPSGANLDEPYRVCIYENNDEYSETEPYELSREEHP